MAEIYKIVFLLGLGQGILVACLLLMRQQGDRRANIILAIYVIAMLYPLWDGYIQGLAEAYHGWSYRPILLLLPCFYGPLLYFYTRQLTVDPPPTLHAYHWHLAGPLWAAILIWPASWFLGPSALPTLRLLLLATIFGSIFIYAFWTKQLLNAHAQRVELNLSNVETVNLRWLQVLVYGFIALFLLDLLMMITARLGWSLREQLGPLFTVAESVYIFVIGLFSLQQTQISFQQLPVYTANKKYDKSSLDQSTAVQLLAKLDQLMTQEALFLDNQISLSSLATELAVSPHHLSQTLNEHLGKSFYDYINQARIERAKVILTDPAFAHLSVLDIAFEIGFNNKTSFNNAFKKYTTLTPTQYRKTGAAGLAA